MSEEVLLELLAAGKAAWGDLPLDDQDFLRFLRERAADGGPPLKEHAAELFLACACARGVTGAATAFERAYRVVVERAVARVDRAAMDEGTQVVLVSLLVATPDSRPGIATYGGRSSLRTWLATVATRATLKLHRRKGDQSHESVGGLEDALLGDEPELALAKARHGPELAESLREAIAALEPRQLVLLRLHYAKGWSVDRLGALYRVGRSTAARWVAAARDALVEGAKRGLRERLDLTPSELTSLIELLRSNLEVSLLRLLDGSEPGASAPEGGAPVRRPSGRRG